MPTLCHAEQPKPAETQLTEPWVMLEPCRSGSRALAVDGAQRGSQGCSVGMEGKAGGSLSRLPCRRCCAVSPVPRLCGAGNAQPLRPPWPHLATTACTHLAVPLCSPNLSSIALGCALLSGSHHCGPPAALPSSLADSSGIPRSLLSPLKDSFLEK